jgi:hypothetical protein
MGDATSSVDGYSLVSPIFENGPNNPTNLIDIQSTAIDIERVLERESRFCPIMADTSVLVPRVY